MQQAGMISSLRWRLLSSYFVIITISILALAGAAAYFGPRSFGDHLDAMRRAGTYTHHETEVVENLYANYSSAVTQSIVVAALVAALTAVAASLLMAGRISEPLARMRDASRRIATGQRSERVAPSAIRELRELADSFNSMATQLEATERLRQQMLADVAHELRTPLTSIKGYIEGLVDGVFPANASTYDLLSRETDRLHRLVSDLHELSLAEAGSLTLNHAQLELGTLICEAIEWVRPQFLAKGVQLQMETPSQLIPIMGDADRLTQVLLNVLSNALRHTPTAGYVTVTVTQYPDTAQIVIRDTGSGIAPEHLPAIFERFYRADPARDRNSGGSGIGLTIARSLVEAHGGQIEAASQGLGHGSTFIITLPRYQR